MLIWRLDLEDTAQKTSFGDGKDYFGARKVDSEVTKQAVWQVINCDQCQSIDPMQSAEENREILIEDNWQRLVVDVT